MPMISAQALSRRRIGEERGKEVNRPEISIPITAITAYSDPGFLIIKYFLEKRPQAVC
jgi:hypothetical protein